ncbi:MAG: glycosyltransferase family 4 protein [Candidatus Falkowbacteria bacterium]
MKLLICTQKVDINDDVLGFFHSWIREFAKHYEKVTVICLYKGEYDLPENVKVLSLGKERKKNFQSRIGPVVPTGLYGFSIFPPEADPPLADNFQSIINFQFFNKIAYILKFYKYIFSEKGNYDKVFVHMNSEYAVLGGGLWRLWNKKIGLWYVHKAIPWQLRIAEKFVDVIFTASKESCNLKSNKIRVIGHGIDLEKFQITNPKFQTLPTGRQVNSKFVIVYVGRISRIKNQELLIRAIDILRNDDLSVKLIGGTVYDQDKDYLDKLKKLVKEKKLDDVIEFVGAVPNKDIGGYYGEADLALNLCPTGGVDKAVLEAMAAGVPVIVFNKTFADVLGDYKEEMILRAENAEELAGKIKNIMGWGVEKRESAGKDLRGVVKENYGLESLIGKIKNLLKMILLLI